MISSLKKFEKLVLISSKQIYNQSNSFSSRLNLKNYCTRYTFNHEWVTLSNNNGRAGITDYGQKQKGTITKVNLQNSGDYQSEQSIGFIKSDSYRMAKPVYSPINLTITNSNSALNNNPGLINTSPESDGWLIELQSNDISGFQGLMTSYQYQIYCQNNQ